MEEKRYYYSIWQRPMTDPKTFIPVKDNVTEVIVGEYVHVYDWMTDKKEDLEEIFERFNLNQPNDYHARSLSVSDLILMRDKYDNKEAGYIVDVIGFKKVKVITQW